MNNIIKIPNLPQGQVSCLLMSGEYEEICKKVKDLNIKVIKTKHHKNLPPSEAYHADLQCQHLGYNKIMLDKGNTCLEKILSLEGFEITYTRKDLNNSYPNNVLLNSAVLENCVILNQKTIDPNLIDSYKEKKLNLINVNQGYAKCSTAIINSNSIITSDPSIYKNAKEHNIDALKIVPGHIDLPGYNYGFIGGACSLIDKNKILFIGDINTHPDAKAICDFINYRDIEIVNLVPNKRLLDIGGMIPLKQCT